jgi:hypothetical protein
LENNNENDYKRLKSELEAQISSFNENIQKSFADKLLEIKDFIETFKQNLSMNEADFQQYKNQVSKDLQSKADDLIDFIEKNEKSVKEIIDNVKFMNDHYSTSIGKVKSENENIRLILERDIKETKNEINEQNEENYRQFEELSANINMLKDLFKAFEDTCVKKNDLTDSESKLLKSFKNLS